MTTSYDDVAYPGLPFALTQPSRLGVVPALFGLEFGPAETARVLEIGCGDGGNLWGMALAWPDAQFVGFDLAPTAVETGRRMVEALGLKNLRIEVADVTDAPDYGRFDYVIAHGFYAWVPPEAQDAAMAMIGRVLEPHGVGFVSYNALPGARIRQMMRDMLLYRLRGVDEPKARMEEMLRFLQALADGMGEATPAEAAVRKEARRMLKSRPHIIFHDELNPFYAPVYVSDFLAHAKRHGLVHLGEAEPFRLVAGLPEATLADFGIDPEAPPEVVEQYTDFFAVESFRQTLLRPGVGSAGRKPDPMALRKLHAASTIHRDPDVGGGFKTPSGSALKTQDPRFQALLDRFAAEWPRTLPLSEVDEALLPDLLRLHLGDVIELHTAPRRVALEPGERPRAFALARHQAATDSPLVTNLMHTVIELTDEAARLFVGLLDGTRTRAEIAAAMAERLGAPVEAVAGSLDDHLRSLGRMGLLEA